jgi:hypothetical protein
MERPVVIWFSRGPQALEQPRQRNAARPPWNPGSGRGACRYDRPSQEPEQVSAMRRIFPLLVPLALLAACAAEPETGSATSAARDCRSADAPTGSHMVRRSQCDRTAGADGDAQRSAEQLQEAQRQTLTPPGMERR